MELGISDIAWLALSAQYALVPFVAVAFRIEVTLSGASAGLGIVAVDEIETGGTGAPEARARSDQTASQALSVVRALLARCD